MNNTKKLFSFAVILFAFTAATFAQGVTATATATATIITPLTITYDNVPLAFGNVAVGAGGGELSLATDGTRTVTLGDVSFQTTPAGTAARFIITGVPAQTYSITLPADGVVTIINGANSMSVNDFVSNPATTGTLVAGNNILLVGATLVVNGGQAAGAYTGTFDVTVAYN